MANLQHDVSQFQWLFTIIGLRELIKRMAETGQTKVDILNVDLENIQDILSWITFYYQISELKQLKDKG